MQVAAAGENSRSGGVEQSLRQEYRSTLRGLSLGGLSVWSLTKRVWNASFDDEIYDRAAELAYYFLFALFPGLIFLSAIFGVFASTRVQSEMELMRYLGKVIPQGAFQMVQTTFDATTKGAKTSNIVFGAVTALWAASYGMTSAQTVLNTVFRLKETRPYWKVKLISILLTLTIIVLVFVAMVPLLLGDALIKLMIHHRPIEIALLWGWKIVQVIAAMCLLSIVFSVTYHWGPNRPRHRWRWISPGSLVGICGWVAASIGFRVYLHFFNNYAALYGSLGTVIILLTWFYVSGLMLLVGAEINANVERADMYRQAQAAGRTAQFDPSL